MTRHMFFIRRTKKPLCTVLCGLMILSGAHPGLASVNFEPKRRTAAVIAPPSPKLPIDEKLVYKVNWWGAEIGTGEIHLTESGEGAEPSYRIEAQARDNDYLRSIFPVHDQMSSTMNPEGHSLSFGKNVKEGKYRANEITDFDYAQNKAKYRSITNGSTKESAIPGPVHDVLTAFYWVRKQPLQLGDSVSTTVFLNDKTWDFTVKVKEIKSFSLPGQKSQDVMVLAPEVRLNGVLVNKGKARIYATADERRIPLLIRLDTPYGPVTGVLASPLP